MHREQSHRVGPIEELNRRRVLRVGIAYVAIAYVALEGVRLVLASFVLPAITWRVALGLAVLGFPVAVVLSFVYDITPSGIVRTPDDATDDPTYDAGPWKGWVALVLGALAIGLLFRSMGN